MAKYTVAMTAHARPPVQAKLEEMFDLKIKKRETTKEEWLAMLEGADAIYSLGNVKIGREALEHAPKLKIVAQVAVGYDSIDVPACTERGVLVSNTPGVVTQATADIAFGLILLSARQLHKGWEHVKSGEWGKNKTFPLSTDLYGKTLGIFGLGSIGVEVASRARASGMKIAYHNRRPSDVAAAVEATYLSREELLSTADFILAMTPLSKETEKMIGRAEFSLMKPTARFINAARGAIVDTDALYEALKDKRIAYAAIDVTDPEPLPGDHKLLTLDNILVTPHIGTATEETRNTMCQLALDNIIAAFEGTKLPSCVNKELEKT